MSLGAPTCHHEGGPVDRPVRFYKESDPKKKNHPREVHVPPRNQPSGSARGNWYLQATPNDWVQEAGES